MHPIEALLTPLGWAFRNRHADESASISHAPELATTERIAVTSLAFRNGTEIPAKYCGKFIGDNISPGLEWGPLPAGTAQLLLVIEDLNSPGRTPRLHAVAAFAPTEGRLAEGALATGSRGVGFLNGPRGPLTYAGPRPLPGHGPHYYRFHLYALDTPLDIESLAGTEALLTAVGGHVLASGVLTGMRES